MDTHNRFTRFGPRSKEAVVIVAALLVSSLLLVFAYNAYPVPAGDSMFFLVPTVQFAKYGNLTSPILPESYWVANVTDPSGVVKFLFYPPLFQLVLSFLMPTASPGGVLLAVSFINIAVVLLSALLFYKFVARKGNPTWLDICTVVVAIFALVASLAETGRPEVLARLWITLGALVPFYVSKKYDWIFYGVLLGLVFGTHVAAGVLFTLVLGLLLGITFPLGKIVLRGAAILFIAFFVALGAIAFGPFGIQETVEGTLVNAVMAIHTAREGAGPLTFQSLLNHYVFSQTAPFYLFVVLALFVSGFFFFSKYRKHVASPAITWLSAVTIGYVMGKIVYTVGHVYYITLFAPIVLSVILLFFLETGSIGKGSIIVILALVVAGFLRTAFLFPSFIKQDQGLDKARARIAEVVLPYKNKDVRIGIGGGSGGGAWYFVDDYKNMYPYSVPEKPKEKTAIIFLQQRYSGMLTPPEIPECVVMDDLFSRDVPRMFGIRIGNTMPGYGYAIYNCLENDG